MCCCSLLASSLLFAVGFGLAWLGPIHAMYDGRGCGWLVGKLSKNVMNIVTKSRKTFD